MQTRSPEIVVLSDLHLGTYGCHARSLLAISEVYNLVFLCSTAI